MILFAIIATGFSIIPNAMAHSSAVSSYYFTSSSQNICYDITSLNSMKYEGSTGQGSTVAAQIQIGEDEMDNNTNLNISHDTSCQDYESRVMSFYDSSSSILAKTILPVSTTLGNEYKTIEFNSHSNIDWQSDGNNSCGSSPELSRIANHEFGHFAGMEHHDTYRVNSGHTMMKPLCSNQMDSIKSADENQVNGEY